MSKDIFAALIIVLETLVDLLKRLEDVLWPSNE